MALDNTVLFVCSHNSARSQMAHGWLKHLTGDRFKVYSAGVEPGSLNPLAVQAMQEVGIDIADHKAEGIKQYLGHVPVYYLIIVCDQAAKSCPHVWPGMAVRLEWSFEDPSAATGSHDEQLAVFRRVRDEIRVKLEAWLAELDTPAQATTA